MFLLKIHKNFLHLFSKTAFLPKTSKFLSSCYSVIDRISAVAHFFPCDLHEL